MIKSDNAVIFFLNTIAVGYLERRARPPVRDVFDSHLM